MPTEFRRKELALLGAGGHAKVVFDAIKLTCPDAHVIVCDDANEKQGVFLPGVKVRVPIGDISDLPEEVHVAIGSNAARCRLGEALLQAGKKYLTVCHPQAMISDLATLAEGVFVAAGAVVAPSAKIGMGAIINHAAVVDHDCSVGAWSHIAPNAVLGGGVVVGKMCLVGASAVILPGISVGDSTVIGAGAVVTRNLPPGVTAIGVPAKLAN